MPYKPNVNQNGEVVRDLRDVDMSDWGTPQVNTRPVELQSAAFGNYQAPGQAIRGQLPPPRMSPKGFDDAHMRILERLREPAFFPQKPDMDNPLSMMLANAYRRPGGRTMSQLPLPIEMLKGIK